MRSDCILRMSRGFRILVILLAGIALVGCTAHGPFDNGFIDPTEVGRFKKQPLLMPILSTLDTGIEEPNDQFSNATEVRPDDLIASDTDYVIGPDDLLTISITDLVATNVETVKQVRVSATGNISLPLLGQIRAEGLTQSQLEQAIVDAYGRANIIPNANVSVTITEARGRTFSILGQVAHPGQYQILQSDFRVLDALVMAGDVNYNGQGIDNIYVIRYENKNKTAPPTTPAGATTLPHDILAPRSDTDNLAPRKDVSLDASEQNAMAPSVPAAKDADQASPSTRSSGTMPAEQRYGIVEGKPVSLPDNNSPASAPTATEQAEPIATTQPSNFEFNNPMGAQNARIIRIPLDELRNGQLKYNIVIRPHDMIIVPAPVTGEYWVAGHVQRTGVYSLTARKITLKEAIDGAGGFDALAIPARTELIRRIGKDKEENVMVDMDKIYAGLQPDIYLKPYDQVRVGTNAFAPFIAAVRNGFRITYGFGFLYDRNWAPQAPLSH